MSKKCSLFLLKFIKGLVKKDHYKFYLSPHFGTLLVLVRSLFVYKHPSLTYRLHVSSERTCVLKNKKVQIIFHHIIFINLYQSSFIIPLRIWISPPISSCNLVPTKVENSCVLKISGHFYN